MVSDFFSFIFHMIGLIALVLHFVVLYTTPYVYKWFHTPFDRYEIEYKDKEDGQAAILSWLVFLVYFIWCCLGVFTFQWFLFIPLALSCLIFPKYMSAPMFRWRASLSILIILLTLVNFTHYGMGKPKPLTRDVKVITTKKVTKTTVDKVPIKKPQGQLKWGYGRGFFKDSV